MSGRGGIRDEVGPPKDAYVRQRWIKRQDVEWAELCNEIMMEHGVVESRRVYEKQVTARNRARKLIRYMVELRLHERWELKERITRLDSGFIWGVEYVGGRQNGSRARQTEHDDDD